MGGAFYSDSLSGLRAASGCNILYARALSFDTAHIDQKLSVRCARTSQSCMSAPRGWCAIFRELEDPVGRAHAVCLQRMRPLARRAAAVAVAWMGVARIHVVC